jgi:putative Mg2+ transporter-C (MgtC) family protein
MDQDFVTMTMHLVGAMAVGGVIGLERSYHGRPAGFRTHTLVCLAASLLMLVTLYQNKWLPPGAAMDSFRTDPTRMAQGIMTGIGFLGAGVIFKEGLSVRGLTTAASIWITSAIGILIGIGFYYPAIVATFLTVGTLSLFRLIEARIPAHHYAQHYLSFDRNDAMEEDEIRTDADRPRLHHCQHELSGFGRQQVVRIPHGDAHLASGKVCGIGPVSARARAHSNIPYFAYRGFSGRLRTQPLG